MWIDAVILGIFVIHCFAQEHERGETGVNSPGPFRAEKPIRIIDTAGTSSNKASSVAFEHPFNGTTETWTWHINVSETVIPPQLQGSQDSEEQYFTNTQWSLNWPGDSESLVPWLRSRNTSLSFVALLSNKPTNITDRYRDQDNGNCTALFGESCTKSLYNTAMKPDSRYQFNTIGLEGCEDTFDITEGGAGIGASIDGTESSPGWRRGDTIVFSSTKWYNASDKSTFDRATQAVQVLLLNTYHGNVAVGGNMISNVLCRIVEKALSDSSEPSSSSQDDSKATTTVSSRMLSLSSLVLAIAQLLV